MSKFDCFRCIDEIPLPANCCESYVGMAFDGCNYYFTVRGACKIIQYDAHFCEEQVIHTCKEYSSICYDANEKCFWAASTHCLYTLFKLNRCMQEIDCMKVQSCEDCGGLITGISCDCCDCALLISSPTLITKVYKCDRESEIIKRTIGRWFTSVLALPRGYLTAALEGNEQYISAYAQDGKLLWECCVPKAYVVRTLLLFQFRKPVLCIYAVKRGCYPYICKQYLQLCEDGCRLCDCECGCEQSDCVEQTDGAQPNRMLELLTLAGTLLNLPNIGSFFGFGSDSGCGCGCGNAGCDCARGEAFDEQTAAYQENGMPDAENAYEARYLNSAEDPVEAIAIIESLLNEIINNEGELMQQVIKESAGYGEPDGEPNAPRTLFERIIALRDYCGQCCRYYWEKAGKQA